MGLFLLLNINSKSGGIFTLEKEFFKLLFGVKITPPKNNSSVTGFIQKNATIFEGLFKDHIRFSKTTY